MTARDTERAGARQALRSLSLLGVDFIPVSLAAGEPCSSPGGVEETAAADDRPAGHDPRAALEALRIEHDEHCPHCTVAEGHTRTVFGEGSARADLMFVGEAPGAEEDRTGRPFVGRAGRKLDDMIAAMGLRREDVYIANILKSRPPGNRTPLQHEVEGCAPYLARQIALIRPRVIVALGGPAAKFMLRTDTGITRLRGIWGEYAEDDPEGADATLRIPVMPTFHPAYLLRNYTRDTREKVWSDLQAVLGRLAPA